MKLDVYNKTGKTAGEIDMPEDFFSVQWKPDLVHQALVAQESNSRENIAHTKGRSEVRGGGKKPWRQKGTGRARVGSTRSPIWRSGGITFGPTNERNYSKKINKKMKKLALFSVLSKKLVDGEIKVIDTLSLSELKTKQAKDMLSGIRGKETGSMLLILAEKNKNILKAIKNLPRISTIAPQNLNVRDCLSCKFLVFEKDSLTEMVNHYKHEPTK